MDYKGHPLHLRISQCHSEITLQLREMNHGVLRHPLRQLYGKFQILQAVLLLLDQLKAIFEVKHRFQLAQKLYQTPFMPKFNCLWF